LNRHANRGINMGMDCASAETGHMVPQVHTPPRDAAIAETAGAQHGVLSLPQLQSLGLSASGVRKRAAAGKLHRMYRGVYAVGHSRVTWKGRYMAAVLTCGDGAVLSHRSAARLIGLRRTAGRLDVTVPDRVVRVPGIDAHRTRRLDPRDVIAEDRIPCTSPARTICDLAAHEGDARRTEKDIARAEELRIFDLGAVQRILRERPGARVVHAALGVETIRSRNELEERFYAICEQAGLPRPLVNMPLVLGDGAHVEADFAWPDLWLIVETDGWATHGTHSAFVNDRRRDRRLALVGWRVLRFTWYEIEHEPERVAAELGALLALAS
jgi:predicted transcriptional regulator of viral defense system